MLSALKPGAAFILTDYFAPGDELESEYRQELLRLKKEQGIADDAFYHHDTPLTSFKIKAQMGSAMNEGMIMP